MHKKISLYTATAIVISNMIGTGVFTSLGYQVLGLKSGFALLVLWLLGGVAALLGALCYGELGAALPRSGGEYNYLSKIFHPSIGFLSGWVSATVGFAAPVAAAAMAFAAYLKTGTAISIPFVADENMEAIVIASVIVIAVSCIHFLHVKIGSRFQNIFTGISILTILVIIINGFMCNAKGDISFVPNAQSWEDITSSSFALSFFFVTFAYSGWNAAAYIAGEMEDVKRNLPKALLQGTTFVTVLYLLLNFIFLYTTPVSELAGKKEVGYVAATYILGSTGGKIMAIIIAIKLISTISSMTIAGPRIINVMGEDFPLFKILSKRNKHHIPVAAIVLQGIIAIVFIATSSFDQVITYIGFTLNLFTFLTVLGLIVLRRKQPNLERPFKTPFYPIVPILFLCISAWLVYYGVKEKPLEALAGLGTLLVGLAVYFLSNKKTTTP